MARAKVDPAAAYGRHPLQPHELADRVTRTLPSRRTPSGGGRVASVDGLVHRPVRLTFGEFKRRPAVDITSIHQCCGSPLRPEMPTRRVCNVVWTGVRLSNLLTECQPEPAARFLWSSGADHGVFEGEPCDAFTKDLPLDRVPADVPMAMR